MSPSRTPRRRPASGLPALHTGAFALATAGSALLLAATAATVVSVRVGSTVDPVLATGTGTASGWERHGPALVLLALAALPLALVALRGSRAAALALAALGLTALLIALAGDLPAIRDEAAVREIYADSEVGPGLGWHLETAGAITLLLAGATGLVLPAGGRARAYQR